MTGSNPRVSIITACYNSAAVLGETVRSVLGQTFPDIEYLIIDGGSDDGTVDIINKYAERISYWVSEPDRGIAHAWNKGLARCSGEIVGLLNAGDTYTPDAVAKAVAALETDPGSGFVFGDAQMCTGDGEPCYRQQGDPAYGTCIFYDMPSIPHPTVFVRREVYERFGGFDEKYRTAMDYEFLLRITKKGVKGSYIPAVLVNMRLGGVSDVGFIRGYREVMQAAVRYGCPSSTARACFYYKCLKSLVRRGLERLGLHLPVRLFRTYCGRRYKY